MRKSAFIRNLLLIAVATALSAGFAGICFGADVPVVSNIAVVDNADGTATVTWDTDIPALGAVNYGSVSVTGYTITRFTVEETADATSHSVVITGILPQTKYKIVIVNNGAESQPIYWPGQMPSPCALVQQRLGCPLNILDLIFLRNRLGQSVSPGDPADLNDDGSVNILDMLILRNCLNAPAVGPCYCEGWCVD